MKLLLLQGAVRRTGTLTQDQRSLMPASSALDLHLPALHGKCFPLPSALESISTAGSLLPLTTPLFGVEDSERRARSLEQESLLLRTGEGIIRVNVNENTWKDLEEEIVPLTSNIKSNWLESQTKLSLKTYNDSRVCVVGEAIKLHIEFKNPLQIPISVSGISLICDIFKKSEETNFDGDISCSVDAEELKGAPSCRNRIGDAASLVLSEFDLVLGGGEVKRIQVDATPQIEGVLKILGVRWKLSEFVVGYHYFEPYTLKKHNKRKQVSGNLSEKSLSFIVIKGLPKLEGRIHNLPGTVFAGDLRLLRLELINQSDYSVKKMKMAISHPRFFIPGKNEDMNMNFPSCLEKQKKIISMDASTNVQKFKNLLFYFPNDATIGGGATFYWPLWFHAGCSGKLSVYFSIYYEIESCSSDMIYRTLRMHYDLEVFPSLDISIQIAPCTSKLQEYFVRMDIKNMTCTENFSMQQLSCADDQLEISTLPANESICPLKVLHAGQALSCFFKLKQCRSLENGTRLSIDGKDALFDAKNNKKVLIDSSRSPLTEFHQHERYHQEKTVQGAISNIDFILISELQEKSTCTELQPTLLSHHACHCSITTRIPIWWLMEGPRAISLDFSSLPFHELDLELTIRNCTKTEVFVRIAAYDIIPETKLSDLISDSSINHGGWKDISLPNNEQTIANIDGLIQSHKSPPPPSSTQSISPYIWCAASSTSVKLQPSSTARVPLRICIFSPGTYDLSSYELHWNFSSSGAKEAAGRGLGSGVSRGHPFYLTVIQSSNKIM